jgi:Ca2+-binding EF-hand superfamily protein
MIKSTLFDVIDTNHDGTIDFNEFLFLAAIGNRTGSLDERLDIVFDLYVLLFIFFF